MRRSMLFLPGNTPNIIMNADVLGADSVILDLEDAVAPDQKDAARILVRNTLKTMKFQDCEVIVRINPLSSGEWQQDLEEIIPYRPAIIMPTKISCSQDVQQIAAYMGTVEKKAGNPVGSTRIMPLIETARGVENSYHIAEADPRVCAIFIGCEDLTADLCCERTKAGNEVFYARSRVVCAARGAGIDVYDTPLRISTMGKDCGKMLPLPKAWAIRGKPASRPGRWISSMKCSLLRKKTSPMPGWSSRPSRKERNWAGGLWPSMGR